MLSINFSELIWTIINFFLLYFVLKRFLFDPVCKFVDARQAKIDAGLNEEKQAQEAVRANRERLEAAKAESRLEASGILSRTEAEDEQRSAESLRSARARAESDLADVDVQLARQSEQDEAALEESRGELSALLAERILCRED